VGGLLFPGELRAWTGELSKTGRWELPKIPGSEHPELAAGLGALERLQVLSQKSLGEQEQLQTEIRAGLRQVGAMLDRCLVRLEELLVLPEDSVRSRLAEGLMRLPHPPPELEAAPGQPGLKSWLQGLKGRVQAEIRSGMQRRVAAGLPDPMLTEFAQEELARSERLEAAGWTVIGVCGVAGVFVSLITLLLSVLLPESILVLVLVNLAWVAPAVLVGLPMLVVGRENHAKAERNFLQQQQVFEGEVGPGWVDTGLRSVPVYELVVYTTGSFWDLGAKIGPDGNGKAAPEGSVWPGGPVGALIGRIGEQCFMLGRRERVPSLEEGSLELAINAIPGMDPGAKLRVHVLMIPGSLIDELPHRWPEDV
ncbi:MAG TPA: hypothetical protein PKY30_17815, partial [Myxococcota bacterium]|nr:hypothetical protein [Myxococcota bacterium]